MYDLSLCRLYNLSIYDFHSQGFFFFLVFSLEREDFSNLYKRNMKVTYYNRDWYVSNLNKENRLFIVYNYMKFEIYSLPLVYSRFYNFNKYIDVLNTCMLYKSILYSESKYTSNIKFVYTNLIKFHIKSFDLMIVLLKKFSFFNNNINLISNSILLHSIKNCLLHSLFIKRFY